MNCFRVQSLLSAYVDQELNSEDRRLMRNHLFNCPECSREMESLILIKNVLGSLSAPEVPGDSLRLVHEEIYGLTNTRFHANHRYYFDVRHLLMTAACISLFLMTSTVIFPRIQNKPEVQANRSDTVKPDTAAIASSRENNTTKSPSTMRTKTVSEDQQSEKNEHDTPELFERLQISPILSGTPVSR